MKSKSIVIVIALIMSAACTFAGTGYTTQYNITTTGSVAAGTFTATMTPIKPFLNGTNSDRVSVKINGDALVYGPLYAHKNISWIPTDPSPGTVTKDTNGGGSGGGGGGKLHGPMNGPTVYGFTVVFTEGYLRKVTTFFVADPWTCGTIFYSLHSDGYWHYDTQNFVPCGASGTIPSSGIPATPYVWKPEWQKEGEGPIQQQPLTDEIRQQVYKLYGFWPKD